MRMAAHAKINFALRVRSRRPDGFHPVDGLFQSVSLSDELELLAGSDDPGVTGWDGEAVPDGDDNLAWRAVRAVLDEAGSAERIRVRLRKRIPVAAGLGGGSADAAAALIGTADLLGVPIDEVLPLAAGLGSDVPFCVTGGSAVVSGRGERVDHVPPIDGFALAIVVPPIELSTPAVFRQWDRMGEPEGPVFPTAALPPALREYGPLRNDLYPAAVAAAPGIEEWRSALAETWVRPVAMSGSGSALFAFFVDAEEAVEAATAVPTGVRSADAVAPTPTGWEILG